MGGLLVQVSWQRPIHPGRFSAARALGAGRGPDGIDDHIGELYRSTEFRSSHGAGEAEEPQSLFLDRFRVFGDVRLFDRGRTARRLGISNVASDRDLIAMAYDRVGDRLGEFLIGEFVVVIVDPGRRVAIGVRDSTTTRPLFYTTTDGGFAFASEPKQLRALLSRPSKADRVMVGELLVHRYDATERSFYDGISRLIPGFRVTANPHGLAVEQWWRPDHEIASQDWGEDVVARYRMAMDAAVGDRLSTKNGSVIHLSGGLDSTAVAASAASIARSVPTLARRVTTLSCRYPGEMADEPEAIAAMARTLPFESLSRNAVSEVDIAALRAELVEIDAPFGDATRGSLLATLDSLHETSSRQLLTGRGGDEVVHEEQLLADLLASGHIGLFVGECIRGSRYSWNTAPALARMAVAPVVPPRARQALKRLRSNGGERQAPWIRGDFADWFFAQEAGKRLEADLPSRTQRAVIELSTHPMTIWGNEAYEAQLGRRGLQVTHPFLDQRVVLAVASIPVLQRLPRGRWKMLTREAFRAELPTEVRDQRRKARFDNEYDRSLELLLASLGDDYLDVLASFLDLDRSRRALRDFQRGAREPWSRLLLWNSANLVLWAEATGTPLS